MPIIYPRVALIGRTNVGKSTLWNRFTETAQALTSADPHTTRDRKYGLVYWRGVAFELIDTGGMDTEKDDVGDNILKQTRQAARQADLILFVIDGRTGVLPQDKLWLKDARTLKKPLLLVVNKIDTLKYLPQAHESDIYQLAGGEPQVVSGATGLGIGDLLDEILRQLERHKHTPVEASASSGLRVLFLGRPNVGKSSIVNAILGEERAIVSPEAHTTREPQDTVMRYQDHVLTLVDTAGIRRHGKREADLEKASLALNREALERTDIACLVFDVTQDPSTQDRHLAGLLEKQKTGLILVANKWDLVEDKKNHTTVTWEKLIRQSFPFLDWAPLIFVSALEHQRTRAVLDLALKVQIERERHIDYNALNKLLKACIKNKKPLASYGPKSPRIYDVAQTGQAPPTFVLTVIGEKEGVHPNWLKFFERRLREKFGFNGTPIVLNVRQLPPAKSKRAHNLHGPGMEAVAGPIIEPKPKVNQTRRRQKWR